VVYRVVVADDEPAFRSWLRSLLEKSEDFRFVGEAGSGAEAVQLIPHLQPDLLIADMYMPEPDGVELARYVQDNYPGTKAIVVSAHQDRVYEKLATDEGALAFIPKTKVSLETLRQALRGEDSP
jgi:YesN/AraC family two-component response regulator